MEKEPSVTISLLTWNASKYLPLVIPAIRKQFYKNWELLILDNSSEDDTLALLDEQIPQAKVIRQKKNIGFARGHNRLINWSKSDYVLVINQDVLLEPSFLDTLVDFMEKNPRCASCSGKVFFWDFENNKKTKIIDTCGIKIDKKRQATDILQGQLDQEMEEKQVFGNSGAVVLYRRKALEAVSEYKAGEDYEVFDEDFFAYKEDVDLAWRLRLAGWENWLVPKARAYHDRSIAGTQDLRERRKIRGAANRMSYRNHFMMIYKNSFRKNLLKDFWSIKWYEAKKFVYLFFFERETIKGFVDYLKALPKLKKKRKFIKKITTVNADEMYRWYK